MKVGPSIPIKTFIVDFILDHYLLTYIIMCVIQPKILLRQILHITNKI